MSDDKNPIITGGKKPIVRLPMFILRRSRQLGLLLAGLIVLGAGYGVYSLYKEQKSGPRKLPTVEIAGQKYKVDLVSKPGNDKEEIAAAKTANEESLKRLEAKAASTQATIDDYVTLGQLYEMQGNAPKALESYRSARQMARPGVPNYQNYIAPLELAIKTLENKQ